ncbi:hypothetical protein Tco_0906727 [Tanacetum coccineum]|uniref:Uncharacterized protein n=1 Tax=Tanacetum coccineum TaxID=301880 RepID=A0ABQ5CIR0_9ASTR
MSEAATWQAVIGQPPLAFQIDVHVSSTCRHVPSKWHPRISHVAADVGLEVSWIHRIQELDTTYWGFLRVGATLDIFQNIILILYLEYGVWSSGCRRIESYSCCGPLVKCRHGYAVSSLMDTAYWYGKSKIDDTTSENNKHRSYGSTSWSYLGNYAIAPDGLFNNSDHQENPTLSMKSYFPNFSQENHNRPQPRNFSFKDWLKVKIRHTNVDKTMKNVVLNEWILDSFELESNSSGMSKEPYSRDLEEYKVVFDNEIA